MHKIIHFYILKIIFLYYNIYIVLEYTSCYELRTKEGKLKIYIYYTNIIMYTINYGIYVIYFKFLLSA